MTADESDPDPHHRQPEHHPEGADPRAESLPRPDQVADARERVAKAPLDPGVWAVDVLGDAFGFPTPVDDDVLIVSASVTRGQPRHGAMRSDDHLGSLEVVAGNETIRAGSALDVPDECPVCGLSRTTYTLSTHHHIAGHESAVCAACGREHDAEMWG